MLKGVGSRANNEREERTMKKTLVFLTGLAFLLMPWSEAMPYPDKPIKAIVGYEAGSAVDINARIFFQFMEKELGQPIAVVNKPGAAGSLGLREVQGASPDGYTIGVSPSINVLKLQGLLPYTHHDFDVLAVPAYTWCLLAVPAKSPFKDAKELVASAKANPGQLKMSTTTKGAVFWMLCKYFERITGTKLNVISNPGGGTYIAAQLGGGHADAAFASLAPLKSQIDAGNIRVLGTTTAKRVPGFDQWPTLKESGIDMVMNGWIAYVAPKGLPQEVYKKLVAASAKVAATKEYVEENAKTGSITTPDCIGQEAVKFLDEDAANQRPILEELGAAKDK